MIAHVLRTAITVELKSGVEICGLRDFRPLQTTPIGNVAAAYDKHNSECFRVRIKEGSLGPGAQEDLP